jgi:hypothetical protein
MKSFFIIICIIMVVCTKEVNATVFALHEHELKSEANIENYETEVAGALQKMHIPGLLHVYHLKGFKGKRTSKYAVLWVFESPRAIENNFGTLLDPRWPADWLFYENEVLAKYLTCHPDKIHFTDYGVITDVNYTRCANVR